MKRRNSRASNVIDDIIWYLGALTHVIKLELDQANPSHCFERLIGTGMNNNYPSQYNGSNNSESKDELEASEPNSVNVNLNLNVSE